MPADFSSVRTCKGGHLILVGGGGVGECPKNWVEVYFLGDQVGEVEICFQTLNFCSCLTIKQFNECYKKSYFHKKQLYLVI